MISKQKCLKHLKKEIRILGIDDAPFNKFRDKKVLVIGTVFRGGHYMDALLSCYINADSDDATAKLINLVKKTKHLGQLRCIMINGISLGGFNVVDIKKLNKKTKLPVIVIIRHKPNFTKILKALEKANKKKALKRFKLMEDAGKPVPLLLKNKKIYFQAAGISTKKAKEIIKMSSTHSSIPEPLRISHIIASGIILGESKGCA
ncbi:MAG: DUF99 family protein [Candidatus Pacearchaeota archaeon]|nr:DUF99 family protein [Candidatus Pacearchaeota archaeon]